MHRADEYAEWEHRLGIIKRELGLALERRGITVWLTMEHDLEIRGPLSEIMRFCEAYKTEIDELGY